MKKEIKRLIIQIFLAAAFLILAVVIEKKLNLPIWANLICFLVPYLIVGLDVVKEAMENLIHGEVLDEASLMTIATIGALIIGFFPNAEQQFAEAVFVMLFFKVGELFEEIAEGKSERAIADLMKIRPDYANVVENGKTKKIKAEKVRIGDILIVKPGEKIPIDGIVVEGKTSLNTVALTGESIPRDVEIDDFVNSGCINLTGVIKIKATKLFSESTASKIIDLVKNAVDNKSKSEKFITKFSRYYTPTVVISACIIALIPPIITGNFFESFPIWLVRALTFLVVSCPCALVISVPLAFFGGIGGASKKGILIKGANSIEDLTKIREIVFDKTGTLTKGVFEVTAIHPEIYDENKLLHLAAHVERYSTHPIAVSLREAYEHEDDDCNVTDVKEIAGNGVKAKVNGDEVYVGNTKLMDDLKIKWKKCKHTGTVIHVAINNEYFGHIVISDIIKESSKKTIEELNKYSINTTMLTGDYENVGADVAKKLEIDSYFTELLPNDKLNKLEEIIKRNNSNNNKVAFVGDGINDAPAIAKADVGIGMGTIGSDASIEIADVVIMDDEISKTVEVIKIAKYTMRIAKENIVFAISVKLIVLLLASLGMAPMWLAVFADVGVTALAVLNSMRTLAI